VLELLDSEQEVLVSLAIRYADPAQALLQGGVYQAAGARRAFTCPAEDVLDDGPSLLALHPALFYQAIHHLLDPLARDGRGPYLQEDQTFQRV